MTLDKLPPFDAAAEQSVIGSLLIDGNCMVGLSLLLKPGDFFRDKHGWIYAACQALYDRAEAMNQITVAHELERDGKLDEVGGAAYLAECVSVVPTSMHAEHYAKIVARTALMRRLIQAGGQIVRLGYEANADTEGTLGKADELLYALRDGQDVKGFVHIREILDGCAEEMTAPKGERKEASRLLTGFVDLDRILGGLHASDLIIMAARPGMGKTSFVLDIARHAALREQAHVGIFSLEMSRGQLAQRLMAGYGGVDLQRLMLGRLHEAEERRVLEAMGELSEAAIFVDDSASQRVSDIRAKAKLLKDRYGLDLVIVDYVGLVHGSGRHENRTQEVGQISRALKGLAREVDVPVLVCAQLSRAVENRVPHVPMLSDLRESGDLEQDADVVLFIYREDHYSNEDEWSRKNPLKPYPKGIADIIVAKHRNGPTGQCSLVFREQSTTFRAIELHREPGYWQD